MKHTQPFTMGDVAYLRWTRQRNLTARDEATLSNQAQLAVTGHAWPYATNFHSGSQFAMSGMESNQANAGVFGVRGTLTIPLAQDFLYHPSQPWVFHLQHLLCCQRPPNRPCLSHQFRNNYAFSPLWEPASRVNPADWLAIGQ